MSYTREKLVDWVQARIDEISPLDQNAVIPYHIIEQELDESAKQILRKAKKQLVYPAGVSLDTAPCFISTRDDAGTPVNHSVIIPVKQDFLRFLRLRLDSWSKPVDDLVSVDVNAFRQQYNTFQSGTKNNPVVAIIPFRFSFDTDNNSGTTTDKTEYFQAIEAFPAPAGITPYNPLTSGANFTAAEAKGLVCLDNAGAGAANRKILMSDFMVIQTTAAEAMPDSLIDPMVWLAAGRCLTSLRKADLAKSAYDNYQFVLDQLLVGLKGEEVQVAGKKQ